MILILGATGQIGSYLYDRFKLENIEVKGTYCKSEKPDLLNFNLDKMELTDLNLDFTKIKYIIFSAAANARPDISKKHWEKTYFTNVVRVKKALDFCFNNNIIPIYLSTDNIFDGVKGNYVEDDRINPINSYGKIRGEIEKYLVNSKKEYVILRMGKVFDCKPNSNGVFSITLNNLKNNQNTLYVTDQYFTPCYIEDLFIFVKYIVQNNFRGVLHLASLNATTRYEIAMAIKQHFGLYKADIEGCSIDFLKLLDKRPKKVDLNIDKVKRLTGYQEKSINYFVNLLKENN